MSVILQPTVGLLSQIAIFAMPTAYLLTGLLVDRVLEPAVGGPGWQVVAPLFGSGPGPGMGLYIATCGVLLLTATLAVYALPAVCHLEVELPDYRPVVQSVERSQRMAGRQVEG